MALRGQAATEYLILLATVLMVALSATALLTWNSGVSSGVKVKQSETYWRAAQPFAIVGAKVADTGTLEMIVQNNLAESVVLKSVRIGGATSIVNTYVGPGSLGSVSIQSAFTSSGGLCEGDVSFTYDTSSFSGLVQQGASALAVSCPNCAPECADPSCAGSGQACDPDGGPYCCENGLGCNTDTMQCEYCPTYGQHCNYHSDCCFDIGVYCENPFQSNSMCAYCGINNDPCETDADCCAGGGYICYQNQCKFQL
jgi:hypothetical protein